MWTDVGRLPILMHCGDYPAEPRMARDDGMGMSLIGNGTSACRSQFHRHGAGFDRDRQAERIGKTGIAK